MRNNIIQKLKNKKNILIILTILIFIIILISLAVIKVSKTVLISLTENKKWVESHTSIILDSNIGNNVYTTKKINI